MPRSNESSTARQPAITQQQIDAIADLCIAAAERIQATAAEQATAPKKPGKKKS